MKTIYGNIREINTIESTTIIVLTRFNYSYVGFLVYEQFMFMKVQEKKKLDRNFDSENRTQKSTSSREQNSEEEKSEKEAGHLFLSVCTRLIKLTKYIFKYISWCAATSEP